MLFVHAIYAVYIAVYMLFIYIYMLQIQLWERKNFNWLSLAPYKSLRLKLGTNLNSGGLPIPLGVNSNTIVFESFLFELFPIQS